MCCRTRGFSPPPRKLSDAESERMKRGLAEDLCLEVRAQFDDEALRREHAWDFQSM